MHFNHATIHYYRIFKNIEFPDVDVTEEVMESLFNEWHQGLNEKILSEFNAEVVRYYNEPMKLLASNGYGVRFIPWTYRHKTNYGFEANVYLMCELEKKSKIYSTVSLLPKGKGYNEHELNQFFEFAFEDSKRAFDIIIEELVECLNEEHIKYDLSEAYQVISKIVSTSDYFINKKLEDLIKVKLCDALEDEEYKDIFSVPLKFKHSDKESRQEWIKLISGNYDRVINEISNESICLYTLRQYYGKFTELLGISSVNLKNKVASFGKSMNNIWINKV